MPRNSSGTYSLYTPGNPVVTSTVISSTWANNTLADLAAAITDSLSRTGDGGMQAPLELTNGAVGAPSLTWATESTSGLYRNAAGDFRFSVGGTDTLTFTALGLVAGAATGGAQGAGTINATGFYDDGVLLANSSGANPTGTIGLTAVNGIAATFLRSDGAPALSQAIVPTWTGQHTFTKNRTGADEYAWQVNANNPVVGWNDTDGGSDAKRSLLQATSATWRISFLSDNEGTIRDVINATRSGVAVTNLAFGNATDNPTYSFLGTGATAFGGSGAFTGDLTFTVGSSFSAGYRGMPSRTITTSDSTAATDNGRSILFTGAGSQTFTVDSDFGAAGNICVVLNGGTGALSVAESLSGTMTWLNGSGTLATGTRTLAIGGIATIWMVDATNAYIWGTGLS